LFWWDRQEVAIAIVGGKTFKITADDGTNTEITGSNADDKFQLGYKPYVIDYGTALYGANGAKIIKIPSTGSTEALSDADAPTAVTHLAQLNKQAIALQADTELFDRSGGIDPESWGGDFDTPQSNPDLTKAIGVARGVLECFGTESLEGWRDSGDTTIQLYRDDSLTSDSNIGAPHSLVYVAGTWVYVDNNRRLVRLTADRVGQSISLTLDRYIFLMDNITDAVAWSTSFDGRPYYIISFITDNKTIAVDLWNNLWFELGTWDTGNAEYNRYSGQSFCYARAWNMYLVGDNATGKIYKLDRTNYQDGGDTLRAQLTTPMIDHGREVKFKKLEMVFKKDRTTVETHAANIMVRWRNNGSTTWGNWRTIDLGNYGESTFTVKIIAGGKYTTRQYQLAITDNYLFPPLVRMTEWIA
jgi:hypothetical protein